MDRGIAGAEKACAYTFEPYFSSFGGFLMCKMCVEIPKLISIGITFSINTNWMS